MPQVKRSLDAIFTGFCLCVDIQNALSDLRCVREDGDRILIRAFAKQYRRLKRQAAQSPMIEQ